MGHLIYQWIDLIWLPVSLFVVHKNQRIKVALYVLSCVMTLRLQVELMEEIDAAHGLLKLMNSHVFHRGLVVYGVFNMLYLILAYFSPRTRPVVFIAASISIYFLAFCSSMILMVF